MAVKLVPALISSAALAAAIYASYFYIKKLSKNRCPKQWKKVGKVQKLYLFPLKSGRFIELQSAECTILGLRTIVDANNPLQLRDRSFVVYDDAEKEVKSGRHLPTLVNIKVSIHDEKNIELKAAQMTSMLLQAPKSTKENKVILHTPNGEKLEGFDCGDEAAKWISQFINKKDSGYRIAYHDASKRRDCVRHQKCNEFYENLTDESTGLFSDLSSFLILNQASLDEYLKRSNYANVSDLHFRPNIVVGGPDLKPFDEDSWDWLKIGDKIIMQNVKECTRCIFTNVDPETGIRSANREPLKTLSKSFVVYGVAEKEVKSGRQLPTLVNIKVSIHDEKNIELEAAQMTSMLLQVPQSTEQNKVFLKIHSGEKIEAFDCGDEAARWISQFIHQIDSGYRMAYHDASKRRDLVRHQKRMEFYENMTDKATGLFSDVSSILIINQASLNEYLKRSNYANVSNLNFRPNIVIDDPDLQPFDEDSWDWLKIGDKIIMRNVKECTRCIFTTVDPETGIRSTSREPLKTLSKYRMSKGPENTPIMGIHTEVKVEGIINVGDEIFIGVD